MAPSIWGVSIALCPGWAQGDSWLQVDSDCPRAVDLWGTSPAPAPFSTCPLSAGVPVSTGLNFQDDSWGGCGREPAPLPGPGPGPAGGARARLGWRILALRTSPSRGARPGLLSGGNHSCRSPPLGPLQVFFLALWLVQVRKEGGNLPREPPSVFMRCFTSCFSRALAPGATEPQAEQSVRRFLLSTYCVPSPEKGRGWEIGTQVQMWS